MHGVQLVDHEKILFTIKDMTHIFQFKMLTAKKQQCQAVPVNKDVSKACKIVMNQLTHIYREIESEEQQIMLNQTLHRVRTMFYSMQEEEDIARLKEGPLVLAKDTIDV